MQNYFGGLFISLAKSKNLFYLHFMDNTFKAVLIQL